MMRNTFSMILAAASAVLFSGHAALALQPGPTEIPEPASLALLAVAVGGAAWLKFRRRG